jgi:hypothetical protein
MLDAELLRGVVSVKEVVVSWGDARGERSYVVLQGEEVWSPCAQIEQDCLNLAEILQHRVDHLERLVDFLTDFGASKDDLA